MGTMKNKKPKISRTPARERVDKSLFVTIISQKPAIESKLQSPEKDNII
jgi:hypothetical protein